MNGRRLTSKSKPPEPRLAVYERRTATKNVDQEVEANHSIQAREFEQEIVEMSDKPSEMRSNMNVKNKT